MTLAAIAATGILCAASISEPRQHISSREKNNLQLFQTKHKNLLRSITKADGVLIESFDRLISELQQEFKGKIERSYFLRAIGHLRETLYNRCPAVHRELSYN